MPFCIKCGNNLLPNAKFCIYCGAKVLSITKPKPVTSPALPSPYKSPIAETYYEEVLRPAAEEKLAKLTPKVKHREAPTKPFEERVKKG
jgi:hypothetical protein